MNADENIQDPENTQNYNKYGYVINNPLMFTDPDGEFFIAAIIIGAVISGYMAGVKANGSWNPFKWNWAETGGKILVGTLIGAISGATGAWGGQLATVFSASALGISGGILGGAISGFAGGAIGGAIGGAGMAALFRENIWNGFTSGLISGAIGGAVLGGISGGIQQGIANSNAAANGVAKGNMFTGNAVAEGKGVWALNNTPKTPTIGKIARVDVGEVTQEIIRDANSAPKLKFDNCFDCSNPRFISDGKRILDLDYFNQLKEYNGLDTNSIIGSRGAVSKIIPTLNGPPNTFSNLNNGHAIIFGPKGVPIMDVSASRIKFIIPNTVNGNTYYNFNNGTKFANEGFRTPESLIKFLGL